MSRSISCSPFVALREARLLALLVVVADVHLHDVVAVSVLSLLGPIL
jgi:hypothetical protein